MVVVVNVGVVVVLIVVDVVLIVLAVHKSLSDTN